MRTRKLSLLAFAAIAALATSCSNDELNDTNNQKGIVIKATAATPQGGADTRLIHDDVSTNMNIVWAAGDAFTVYGGSEKHNYTLVGSGGSASASFDNTGDLWVTAPTGSIYALYPTNATASSPTTITLSLEGQTGTLDGLKNFNYMTASTTYTTGDLNFGAFTHQVAIVKLVLTFPDDVTETEATEVGLKTTGLNKSTVLNLTTGIFSSPTAGDVTTGTTIAITNNQLTAYLCVFGGALTDAKAVAKVGRNNYAVNLSNLTIEAGKMYTATVTLTKQAPEIEWAKGNLVADGSGCKIGEPNDGGLHFQFGSLVGWAGGATGDGTGKGTDNTTPALAIVIKPANFNSANEAWAATGKIWQGTTGTVPFTEAGSASADEKAGVGDPCHYYLGGTWRLPTHDEYAKLLKNNGYPSTGPWKQENNSAINSTLNLTFPSSGYRDGTNNGNLADVGEYGYYWSASPNSGNGYNMGFSVFAMNPSGSSNRADGSPVRCVQEK